MGWGAPVTSFWTSWSWYLHWDWKWSEVRLLSSVQLLMTPWTVTCLCPWNFPGKSTGVSCHFLLHGTFLTQGSNLGLPHGRQMLSPELPGKPLHWDWSHPQTPTGETLLHWHCLPASARGCPSPAPRTAAAFAISVIFHPDSYHLESVSLWFMSLSLLSLEIGKINTVISKFIAGFHINSSSLWGPLEREVGGGDRDGEYMYIQGWFTSMYDKNHYNIVK